jgi:hypothetical protein
MATAQTNPAPSNLELPDGVTLETDQKCVKIKIKVTNVNTDLSPMIAKAVAGLVETREKLTAEKLPVAPIS